MSWDQTAEEIKANPKPFPIRNHILPSQNQQLAPLPIALIHLPTHISAPETQELFNMTSSHLTFQCVPGSIQLPAHEFTPISPQQFGQL